MSFRDAARKSRFSLTPKSDLSLKLKLLVINPITDSPSYLPYLNLLLQICSKSEYPHDLLFSEQRFTIVVRCEIRPLEAIASLYL